jgi:hypothetical protein
VAQEDATQAEQHIISETAAQATIVSDVDIVNADILAAEAAAKKKTTTTTATVPVQASGGATSGSGQDTLDTGLSSAATAALIAAEVHGTDSDVAAFIDTSGDDASAQSGWEYFQSVIDEGFTDLEGSFEALTASGGADETIITVTEIGAGVTADLGSIDVVSFAAFLLLGEYSFGWVVKKVASVFPDPSIFGWHPLAFIQEGINGFGNQFETSAKQLGAPLVNVFIQPIRQILGLFQRSHNATASAHRKISTIVNTTIPAATTGLVDKANTYTDNQVQVTLTSAEAYTDKIHTELVNDIALAKADAANVAQADATKVQSDLISRRQGDEVTLAALSTEVTTTIPDEIEKEINESVATENAALTAAITPLQKQLAELEQSVSNEQASITAANAAIADANTEITKLSQSEVVDEGAIAAQQTTIAAAQATIATSTTAISDLYTQITGVSNTLAPVVAAQQLNTSAISTIEPIVETALPVAIATISTVVNNLKTDVDECMVDNCDTANPNNIQNVLRHLLELFTAAAEIGFIAEAVRDPLGVASTLAPILDAIDSSATDTLNALLEL